MCACRYKLILSFSFLIFLAFSCKKQINLSSDKNIVSVKLCTADTVLLDTNKVTVNIHLDTVYIQVPYGTFINKLIPFIKYTGKKIFPSDSTVQNFSTPFNYTVTAEDGTSKTFVIVVTAKPGITIVYMGSSDNNMYALNADNGNLIWKYTANGQFQYSSPILANGILYAGCTDNNLYAFDPLAGKLIWKFATNGAIESTSYYDVNTNSIFVGSDDHNFYKLDASNGSLLWKFSTWGNVSTTPVVSNGIVYFGSDDSYLYALNVSDGSVKWKYYAGNIFNSSSPVLYNGNVLIGTRDGNLFSIDMVSGKLMWLFSTGGISLELSSPVIYKGLVYIAGWYNSSFTVPGSVYGIDAKTGIINIQTLNKLGFSCTPDIYNGNLYISADDGNVYSVNAVNGTINWYANILPNSAISLAYHNYVFVGGGGTHYFYALSITDGSTIWKYPVGSNGFMTSRPCLSIFSF